MKRVLRTALRAALWLTASLAALAVLLLGWALFQISRHDRAPFERIYAGASALQRRPIVLVHGLNRSGRMWAVADDGHGNPIPGARSMVEALRAGGYPNLYVNTFPDTRRTSLRRNARILKGWIAAAKRRFRAGKVDIIAHSMGALIARAYVQEMDREDGRPAEAVRFGRDVRRLIMITAPHLGSPLADPFARFLNLYAPRTLRTGGGPDLRYLNARPLPCGLEYVSIVMDAGPRARRPAFGPWGAVRALLAFARPPDGDGTISLRSQDLARAVAPDACPGALRPAVTVLAEPGIAHRDAAHSAGVQRAVLEALKSPDAGARDGGQRGARTLSPGRWAIPARPRARASAGKACARVTLSPSGEFLPTALGKFSPPCAEGADSILPATGPGREIPGHCAKNDPPATWHSACTTRRVTGPAAAPGHVRESIGGDRDDTRPCMRDGG